MSQEILIHSTPKAIQVVSTENSRVAEIDMEPLLTQMRVGDIYLAKVVRLIPAMRVAFVEIGSDRTALYHFKDVFLPKGHGYTDPSHYLRLGQLLPVQITKLPRGEKGAVVTGQLQLVGGLVIYQPLGSGIHIAKGISDEQERLRLYDIIKHTGVSEGIMVRSLGIHQSAQCLAQELKALQEDWEKGIQSMINLKKPQLLRQEYNLACTYIRERLSPQTAKIYCDQALHEQVKNYMSIGLQAWLPRLQKTSLKNSPWQTYKVEKIIKDALSPKVILPSGGSIVIEPTEALTVIDVNTEQSLQSIKQTNKEAAQILAQQLRLRNISGVIVVDFIRMQDPAEQEEILSVLRETLAQDPVYTVFHGFSPLGLVEINRKRQGNSWAA